MNRKLFIVFLAVGLFALGAIVVLALINRNPAINKLSGNGTITTEEQTLSRIRSVDIKIPVETTIHSSTENKYILSIDSNLKDCILITDEDRKLIISPKECEGTKSPNISPTKESKLDIYTTDIDRIATANNASITLNLSDVRLISFLTLVNNNSSRIKGVIHADKTELHSNGSGSTTLSGTSKEFTILQQGTGNIFAFDLQTTVSNISLNSSGGIQIFAEGILKVSGPGSGVVLYKGTPTTTISLSGSGQVSRAK